MCDVCDKDRRREDGKEKNGKKGGRMGEGKKWKKVNGENEGQDGGLKIEKGEIS